MSQGINSGWPINDSGQYAFPHSLYTSLNLIQTSGAKWLRLNFRLGSYYKDWITPGANGLNALQSYDIVVNAALNAGLQVLGLLSNESWPGNQTQWTANNAENTPGGNGDNPYLQAFSQNAAVVIASHFDGKIGLWEVWNEPNAWSSNPSPGVYSGSSFIYPSNFAWLLHHIYNDVKSNYTRDVRFVSGGLFGNDLGPILSTSSGADYIAATYRAGIARANWSTDLSMNGSYPLDSIGMHLYIDQGRSTSAAKITQYLQAVRASYVNYEGGNTNKQLLLTEIGWTTATVAAQIQASNLSTTYITTKALPYVKDVYWFSIQDIPEANQAYGLFDGSGNAKPSLAAYQQSGK
jgi:hypothetical protein